MLLTLQLNLCDLIRVTISYPSQDREGPRVECASGVLLVRKLRRPTSARSSEEAVNSSSLFQPF